MGLMDEFEKTAPVQPKCTVGRLLLGMEAQDATDLQEALAKPTISAATIARVLLQHGHSISANTVQRHRRGECHCDRI